MKQGRCNRCLTVAGASDGRGSRQRLSVERWIVGRCTCCGPSGLEGYGMGCERGGERRAPVGA